MITLATGSPGDLFAIYTTGYGGARQLTWTIRGISTAARAGVQATGPGVGFINLGPDYISGFNINWNNFLLSHLGSASQDAIRFCACVGAGNMVMSNGLIDASAGIVPFSGSAGATANLSWRRVTWQNSIPVAWQLVLDGANPTSGQRIFSNNVLDGPLLLSGSHFTLSNNVLKHAVYQAGTYETVIGNLFVPPCIFPSKVAMFGASGNIIDSNYFEYCNDNGAAYGSVSAGLSQIFTNNVIESEMGNEHALGAFGAGSIITGNLILPMAQFSTGGMTGGVTIKNNTLAGVVGTVPPPCFGLGETTNTQPGDVAVLRNNLCNVTQTPGYVANDISSTPAIQTITSGDYNGANNIAIGYNNMPVTSTAYGVHDVHADPYFVDPSRKLATWDAWLGGPGTRDHAIAELSKKNDAIGYNPAYSIGALVDWVRAGFHPTNLAFRATGSPADGSPDIGALTVVFSGGICEATGGGVCYYVDTHHGTGTGTFSNPFGLADIAHPSAGVVGTALQALHAGDILYFRAGTYNALADSGSGIPYFSPVRSGTPGNPITIKAYPDEAVTLKWAPGEAGVALIGSPYYSYVRVMDFIIDASTSAGAGAVNFGVPSTVLSGIEIANNEIIGGNCPICSDVDSNYQGIWLDSSSGTWIHHNNIHGFTTGTSGPSGCLNSGGIKLYSNDTAVVEDNWIHGNCTGVFDKESGVSNTYRRNFLTGNTGSNFYGNNQNKNTSGGPGSYNPSALGPASYFIYDNVIDGTIHVVTASPCGVYADATEVHNNLIRGTGGGQMLSWGGFSEVTNLKVWNNIMISGGTMVPVLSTAQTVDGSNSAPVPVAYFDYNVMDAAPTYDWNYYASFDAAAQPLNLQSMRGFGLEVKSVVTAMSNVFADQVGYVVKPPYTNNGRFGDTMGPKDISIATILDTSRYGPHICTDSSPEPVTFIRGVFSGLLR
jgi:hypothetical protein